MAGFYFLRSSDADTKSAVRSTIALIVGMRSDMSGEVNAGRLAAPSEQYLIRLDSIDR